MAIVAVVKTEDRTSGVNRALDLLDLAPLAGKDLFLKPNFNSADPPPGSTHAETLSTLVRRLQALGAGRITAGDRSGMGRTRAVMRDRGLFRLADDLGFQTLVLDELPAEAWQVVNVPGGHWRRGFAIARPALEAGGVVQTCCLKTHRFGGHFTLSLKNSVGLVAKRLPGQDYDYMAELHSSPQQRQMIAEINAAYRADLVVLDGVEAFVTGGPDRGKQVPAGVLLASADRVAIDAVGVAVLRLLGTTPEVTRRSIFGQDQIARAVELGLGVSSPEEIELVTADEQSRLYAGRIREVLAYA